MKAALPAVLLAGLALAGCCTSTSPPQTERIYMQEGGDTSVCGIFSGWGTRVQPERSEAVYTPVTIEEYADDLCAQVDIEHYATCANRMDEFYRDSLESDTQPGRSTSGPFALLLGGEMYLGTYRSDPFSASFRVSSDGDSCTGSYNAIFGDKDAIFKVRCDNGMQGTARIVRDRNGRDGIGVVRMDDGTRGNIVFGPRTVGSLSAAK